MSKILSKQHPMIADDSYKIITSVEFFFCIVFNFFFLNLSKNKLTYMKATSFKSDTHVCQNFKAQQNNIKKHGKVWVDLKNVSLS